MDNGLHKQDRVKQLVEYIQVLENELEIEKQQRKQEVSTLSATQVSLQTQITALAKFLAGHFDCCRAEERSGYSTVGPIPVSQASIRNIFLYSFILEFSHCLVTNCRPSRIELKNCE